MDNTLRPLRLLLVEDNPTDAELVLREVRRAGFDPHWRRVDTEEDYVRNLTENYDLILSDYAMPQFSGLRALELLKERGQDVPFILISGTIGEETAVAAMREGAADYLIKDRLTRIGQAIERALEDKRVRAERLQTDATLDRLRRHHTLILNSAGEGIYGVDLQGKIVFVNPKAAELLGWDADDLLGLSAHETLHHSRADGGKRPYNDSDLWATLHDGGTRRVNNDVFWRKNGASFRAEYVCAPMRDKANRITGGIITFNDITQQFAAAARLKLKEQQYRLLFETNPNPMWVCKGERSEILAANDAAIAQYGYSRDEFLKLSGQDLEASGERDSLNGTTARVQNGDANLNGESRHLTRTRDVITVEICSSPTVWDGVSARIVTAINVTERRRAEARLREQANIIDRAREAIIIQNFEDRRIVSWNTGATCLFGWNAQEMVGQVSDRIFRDQQQLATMTADLLATGEFRGEIKHSSKEGKEVVTKSHATLVPNSDGSPRSVLIISTDITEQKQLETHLLRAQRLESIGTLASGVAHDLNNILTPILMCTDVLQRKPGAKDESASISLIEQSARRGAAIVKQVLTFARGVEGERVLIKPSHLIEEMIDIARKTFPKSIQISSRYPENLWSIEGDPTQLHQLLLNLSVNARDAMPQGGSLIISAENIEVDEDDVSVPPQATPGSHLLISVTDTGEGMSAAVIDKIFDPFFTTKEMGKGTGLGLSTTMGIVKSHGGFISVASEPNKGTTFRIFLPADVTSDASAQSAEPEESAAGKGEVILVVDDEPSILKMTRVILENRNYRVLCAASGLEALALLNEPAAEPVKAMLTDMNLPHMDGVALIRAAKEIKPEVLFIATTGQSEHVHGSALQELGVVHLLAKPYNTDTLLAMLHTALAAVA